MKPFLCQALAGILCLVLLSGCVKSDAPPETTQSPTIPTISEKPAPAKDFGLVYVPSLGVNPYRCTCLTNRPLLSLAYEGLFVLNENFEPEPVLCDRFAVSEDGMTYILTIRQDALFSDGTSVTAQDVVSSLHAATNSDYYGGRFYHVSGITATERYKLTVTLDTPYENLPLLLDIPVTKSGTETQDIPIGSGPYILQLSQSQLTRNRNWWQQAAPVVDLESIPLDAAETPVQVRDSFELGTACVVCADPNAPAAVGYRCDYELWNDPTTVMQYLGFNTVQGLFSNQTLRAAVTHLIDRETIVSKIYNGFASPASLPCSPASNLYDKALAAEYDYDTEAFDSAVRASGLAGSSGTILVWSADASRTALAHFIADAFSACGITMNVAAVDYSAYQNRLKSGNFDLFLGEVRLSANFDLTAFFQPDGTLNFGGIASWDVQTLCKKALKNSGSYPELYRTVMSQGAICPVLFKSYAVMATRGSVSSMQPALDFVFHQAGGRTLAEAGASYGELSGSMPSQADPTGTPSTAEETPAGT